MFSNIEICKSYREIIKYYSDLIMYWNFIYKIFKKKWRL